MKANKKFYSTCFWPWNFLWSNQHQRWVVCAVYLFEIVAMTVILFKVPYTEIDWRTYMQQVSLVVDKHQFDYAHIRGDTGPIVYPAGFVWVYSCFYRLLDHGKQIFRAQCLFAVIYIVNLVFIIRIYRSLKFIPNVYLLLLPLSKRIHSIFMLRLFNDPIGMLFMHVCIDSCINNRWLLASVFYSLALSIKMNILLFLPAFGALSLLQIGVYKTFRNAVIAIGVQVALAWPFLQTDWRSYMSKSFEFSRVFLYKWTVNWKFVREPVFYSQWFAILLLAAHFLVLLMFLSKSIGFRRILLHITNKRIASRIKPSRILAILFGSNFIGVVFSRSLHYQFYCWYYFSIPYLLWVSRLPSMIQLICFCLIEVSWNIYPATFNSSLVLFAVHMLLLSRLLFK